MDLEQAERFVAAAERDYLAMVRVYDALVTGPLGLGVHEVREARADVLAAQQVVLLAREERRLANRRAAEATEQERLRKEAEEEAALRAHDAIIRERRRREREDRAALDRAAEEGQP